MRAFLPRLALASTVCLIACGEATAPDLDGPAFFEARVNGQEWRPSDSTSIQTTLFADGHFLIWAWQGTFTAQTQSIAIGNVRISGPGQYTFGVSANGSDAGFIGPLAPGDSPSAFYTDSSHTGQLVIQALDTVVHRIVGSFSFVGVRDDGVQAVVSEGAFRVRYNPFP